MAIEHLRNQWVGIKRYRRDQLIKLASIKQLLLGLRRLLAALEPSRFRLGRALVPGEGQSVKVSSANASHFEQTKPIFYALHLAYQGNRVTLTFHFGPGPRQRPCDCGPGTRARRYGP